MSPEPPIKIQEHVEAICKALGVPVNFVTRLDIRPGEVEITQLRQDDAGKVNVIEGEAFYLIQKFKVIV